MPIQNLKQWKAEQLRKCLSFDPIMAYQVFFLAHYARNLPDI